MQHSIRLALALASAAFVLAACESAVVGPQDAGTAQIRHNLPPDDGSGDGGGGGGGGGGGTTVPPFEPPPPPFLYAANLATPAPYGGYYECGQSTHAFWGLGNGTWSNDVTQGTVIYVTGVVTPNSPMHWGFYTASGVQVKDHWTQNSGSNCVVAHEPNGISTADLAPGYYYLYASYMGLVNQFAQETFAGTPSSFVGKYIGVIRVR